MRVVFEPGFFSNPAVHVALAVGAVVAVVSGIVGVLTVARGQSFAGHALTDVATAGGAGAVLFGLSPLLGFVASGVLGGAAMEAVGVQRARRQDLATGIVLGAATGLAALLLYLDSTARATTGVTQQVLFGSIFTVQGSLFPAVVGVAVLALVVVGLVARPLLLSTASPELAAARGVPLRAVGFAFMGAVALAVGLSSLVVGAVLSTALLVGPAASALRLSRGVVPAAALAAVLGMAATWLGVLLSYDSFAWTPSHRSPPVSFFIVAVVVLEYALSSLPLLARRVDGPRRGGRLDTSRAPAPGLGRHGAPGGRRS